MERADIELWPNLGRLHRRAYGGEDVAARPDCEDEEWWPRGPLLPGVDELIEHAVSSVKSSEGLSLFFLLGGAGNGKSFAARDLAGRAGIDLNPGKGELAKRLYRNNVGDVELVLLNDATIASPKDYPGAQNRALAIDIASWWQASLDKPLVGFCCVNRGIVIDEIRAAITTKGDATYNVSAAVLAWLEGRGDHAFHELGSIAPPSPGPQNLRKATVYIGGKRLNLWSLDVDSQSLADQTLEKPIANTLIRQVLEKCKPDAGRRNALCPIRANVTQLTNAGAVEKWADLLKSAELSAGRLLTYRDLWGLIVLSVIGPRTITSSRAGVLRSIDDLIETATNGHDESERLQALLSLAQYRVCGSIFGAPVPSVIDGKPAYPMTTPYQIGFSLVDPAQWGSADSRAIEDAMTLISIGTRPSEQLCKILDNVWSPFDAKLEDAVLEYVQLDICSDSNRRRLIAWFAGYVSRLVGMATGEVGNKNVIDALSVLRRASANGPSPIPASLGPPLRSLIFPSKTGGAGQELLVPAFAARAEPVSESRGDGGPIVVEIADVNSVAMRLRHVSGRVVLECYQAGSENALGQILLDFLLVKEALAWNGEAGQTDATSFVEPRLERCRSTTINGLAPTQRRLAALIDGKVREIWS